jgi:glutathione S-transferase
LCRPCAPGDDENCNRRPEFTAREFSDYRAWRSQPPSARSPLVDSEAVVQYADDYLAKHPWFGGSEFSAADIMMKFPLDMLAKARPDGLFGALTPLPKHAPEGPRQAPASNGGSPDK